MLPPVRAFWALSAHDPERFGLIESLSRRSRAGPIRAGAVLPGHDGIRLPATGLQGRAGRWPERAACDEDGQRGFSLTKNICA
jgi:hypothetical protein